MLQRPLASSNTIIPDSDRLRRISPDEERVPIRLGRDLARQRDPIRIQVMARGGSRQRLNILDRQTVQRDPLHTLQRTQIRQHPGQRIVLAQIGITIGHQHHERAVLDRPWRRA